MRLYGNYEVSQSSVDLGLEENKQAFPSQDQDKGECFLLSLPQKYMQKLCCIGWFQRLNFVIDHII